MNITINNKQYSIINFIDCDNMIQICFDADNDIDYKHITSIVYNDKDYSNFNKFVVKIINPDDSVYLNFEV